MKFKYLRILLLAPGLLLVGAAAAPVGETASMPLAHALLLGLVEGFTEYLPVSSTGHLILAERALGMEKSAAGDAYAICIQAGAILAVLGLYRSFLKRIALGLIGRDREGLNLGLNLLIAFAPAALIGFLFLDIVVKHLFGLWPIVAAWLAGGVAMLIIARLHKPPAVDPGLDLYRMTRRQALGIGLIQCLAIWPGTSRSLVTIVGGVVAGLSVTSAVTFSFLLGAITLSAVTAYGAARHGLAMIDQFGWVSLLLGAAVAAGSAALAVRWMVGYLKRHSLALFGYYRILIALAVAALLLTGVMTSR
jgi:undecaprenyl-diphosphatase